MFKLKYAMILALIGCVCRNGDAAIVTASKSDSAGPTILVITDIAAGDLAGELAINQTGQWPLTRGKMVVAPMAELAEAVHSAAPAEVVMLRTVKSTTQPSAVQARGVDGKTVVDLLNPLTDENAEQLKLDDAAIESADLIPGNAKIICITLVLKKEGAVPSARTRLFRNAIHFALKSNNMTDSDSWSVMSKSPGIINVAMYAGIGSSSSPGIKAYPKALSMDPDIRFTYFGTRELLHPQFMKQFDAVVFCGGTGGGQAAAIGKSGAKIVEDFVHEGGGYVSSCAGSYLASSGRVYSLHLINADVLDSEHWARGMGDVDMELTDAGRAIFGDYKGLFKIHYANGPLLGPGADKSLPDYTTLGYFRSDMHKTAPGGVMPNTPAIIAADYGKGRVLCFSPHPEYTSGLEGFIGRAVHWTLRRPIPTSPAPTSTVQVLPTQAQQ